jgi:hypothetical protein
MEAYNGNGQRNLDQITAFRIERLLFRTTHLWRRSNRLVKRFHYLKKPDFDYISVLSCPPQDELIVFNEKDLRLDLFGFRDETRPKQNVAMP